MRPRHARFLFAWLSLLLALAGCASPAKLAERSHDALVQGDLRKAYEMARRALDKDPSHSDARSAFGAAATRIAIDYRTRIARLAPIDTIDAAREAIAFREFRAEVAQQPVAIATDPDDLEIELTLFEAAARLRYRDAEQSLASGHPKEAYRRFLESEEFDPEFGDLGRRIPATLERALTHVAILPFENQTDVPDLSPRMAERMVQESERRSGSPSLFFTRVIDLQRVFEGTSVAQMQRMTREDALAIGRRLRADRVVYGRYTGLRVDNATQDFIVPLYRKEIVKVADGPDQERWTETMMNVRVRERHIRVVMAWEVVDVHSGDLLAAHEEPREAFARVAWSDLRVDGDCDHYRFAPDDPGGPRRGQGQESAQRWKEAMGSWTLPAFLERIRSGPDRNTWSRQYRGEFVNDTRGHPVFLAVLPEVEDLVFVALHEAEEPVIGTLRDLDPED